MPKKLKDSPTFSASFINRDLTYQQRIEARERRLANRNRNQDTLQVQDQDRSDMYARPRAPNNNSLPVNSSANRASGDRGRGSRGHGPPRQVGQSRSGSQRSNSGRGPGGGQGQTSNANLVPIGASGGGF